MNLRRGPQRSAGELRCEVPEGEVDQMRLVPVTMPAIVIEVRGVLVRSSTTVITTDGERVVSSGEAVGDTTAALQTVVLDSFRN